jgi:hypothetical protein
MSKNSAIDVLLAEYQAMREEIRMILTSMDNCLRTMVLLVGGLLTVAATLKEERVTFIIPTAIFFLGISQMMRASSVNTIGTYCQVIEQKIRETLGAENVVMNWEGGKLWRNNAHPSGIGQIGLYIVYVLTMIFFIVFSYRAYLYWKPSLAIHLLEMFFFILYTVLSLKWNTISTREKWIREMLKKEPNKTSEVTSGSSSDTSAPQSEH